MPGGKWEFISFFINVYFCPHNFRWSRWTRRFYYGSSYKESNKEHVLWQCVLSPAHYRVCRSSFLCLILEDSTSSALRTNHSEHFYTVSHDEMIWNFKTALQNLKDLDLLQCWKPQTSENEELNFKTAFCVESLGAFYLLCNINFLPS